MLTRLSPLAAYRDDLRRIRATQFTEDDGKAIGVAVLVERLATLPVGAGSARQTVRAAIEENLHIMAPIPMVPFADPISADPTTLLARVRALADRLEVLDALQLVIVLLRSAERALVEDVMDHGRLMEHRARVSRVAGDHDSALRQFRELRRFAIRVHSRELAARAYLGFACWHLHRGNYPEMERWTRRVLSAAEGCDSPAIAGSAHTLLAIRADSRGDHPSAIRHGWASYQLGHGVARWETVALNNLAQAFANAGQPATALHGFIAALSRGPSESVSISAWGGLATAAASLEDVRLVELASARTLAKSRIPGHDFYKAQALSEVALARRKLGLDMAPWSDLAAELSARNRFHAIAFRLEEGLRSATRGPGPLSSTRGSGGGGVVDTGSEVESIVASLGSLAGVEDAYALASDDLERAR